MIESGKLDCYLKSHLINPLFLRNDKFDEFMVDRQKQLLMLIEKATGKVSYIGDCPEEGESIEVDEDAVEAELTISAN